MSERILIIDDETNIRMMMRLALEHEGYQVDTASDGVEGLKKFGDGSGWDLVLLDHRMPGMSGTEVQQEIGKRDPDAKVIVATAFGTIGLALEAIQAGAADFLRKPFTAETLRGAVASALKRPFERMTAVPVGLCTREFTRSINGFTFNLLEEIDKGPNAEVVCVFEVSRGTETPHKCKVILPQYVQELAKAHADTDNMPGGERFWQAMCEEALANYLWQHAEMPEDGILRVEDLTTGLRHWMDNILTVELTERHAS